MAPTAQLDGRPSATLVANTRLARLLVLERKDLRARRADNRAQRAAAQMALEEARAELSQIETRLAQLEAALDGPDGLDKGAASSDCEWRG